MVFLDIIPVGSQIPVFMWFVCYAGPKDWGACYEALTSGSGKSFIFFSSLLIIYHTWDGGFSCFVLFFGKMVSLPLLPISMLSFLSFVVETVHSVFWSFSEEIIPHVVVYLL